MSPRMRIDLLVNDMVYRAVNDGFVVLFESHFKRNYIHVLDVVQAFMLAIRNNEMKGNIYNVGLSSANVSKMELCELIGKYVPRFEIVEAAIGKDKDQRNYIVSNEKIEKVGFSPKYSLDDGIQELIEGYKMIKNTKYGNI
jgi:nucleoside-diphosphate-sugar epimerase